MARWVPLIVCIFFILRAVHSVDYFLDSELGNDSNSGDIPTQAWKTLDKLATIDFQGGDNIYLLNGTYTGSIYLSLQSSTPSSPVSILAYDPKLPPILTGTASLPTIGADNANGIVIKGITFYRSLDKSIELWKCSHVTIEGCSFYGDLLPSATKPAVTIWSDETDFSSTKTNITVRQNTFRNWTNDGALSITQATNVLVENNTFEGVTNYSATQFYNTAKSYFRNNLVRSCKTAIYVYNDERWDSTGNVVENNLIENSLDAGVIMRAVNSIIRNNLVSNSGNDSLFFFTSEGMITNGTKVYGNTLLYGGSTNTDAAAVTMDAWNLEDTIYLGSYFVKNNVIRAYEGTTIRPSAIRIDYDPYQNTNASLFGESGWQIYGNCIYPNKIVIQNDPYTVPDIANDTTFGYWIKGNVLLQDSDFVVSGDPTSGLADNSNCKNAMVPLTYVTTATDNGYTVYVSDSRYFVDGAQIMDGDTIVFGDCRESATIDTVTDNFTIQLTKKVSTKSGEGVTVLSLSGCSTASDESTKSTPWLIPVIAGGGGLLLIIGAAVLLVLIRRRKHSQGGHHHEENGHASVPLEATSSSTTTSSPASLGPNQIKILEPVGEGKFGAVYKGMYNKTTPVALKTLKSENKGMEFSREVALLSKLRHPNIIMFHGIWVSPDKQEYMVFEFVNKGNLLSLLQQEKHLLTNEVLLNMALQVASGMSYLEQMKIVHRDLAARNILVKEEGGSYFLKISDFGLSRQTNDNLYQGNDNELPVRWTAPEALIYNTHSHKSDVWSFGILLWEMWEYGKTPYPQFTNAVTRQKVVEGYRLESPTGCPQAVFDLVQQCWHEKPNQRPSFAEIESFFSQNVEDNHTSFQKPPKHMSAHDSTNAYLQVSTGQNTQQDQYQNQRTGANHYQQHF